MSLVLLVLGADATAAATKTVVECSAAGGAKYATRPSGCTFVSADGVGDPNTMDHLKWSSWGGAHAKGKGTLYGNMDTHHPGTITLSGVTKCYGTRFYTRLTIHSNGTTFSQKLDYCSNP